MESQRHITRIGAAGLTLAALLAANPSSAHNPARTVCDVDVAPAATLLVPYFEFDLATPPAKLTWWGVTNATLSTRVVKATLWTDWAIPTASFDMVLGPNDVQTFSVRDLLMTGPPATQVAFPGCIGALQPGRLHFNLGIPAGASNTSYFGSSAQGWVTTVYRANVTGSPAAAAWRSFQLSTVCKQR